METNLPLIDPGVGPVSMVPLSVAGGELVPVAAVPLAVVPPVAPVPVVAPVLPVGVPEPVPGAVVPVVPAVPVVPEAPALAPVTGMEVPTGVVLVGEPAVGVVAVGVPDVGDPSAGLVVGRVGFAAEPMLSGSICSDSVGGPVALARERDRRLTGRAAVVGVTSLEPMARAAAGVSATAVWLTVGAGAGLALGVADAVGATLAGAVWTAR